MWMVKHAVKRECNNTVNFMIFCTNIIISYLKFEITFVLD